MRSYARNHNLRLSELASAISTDIETPTLLGFERWADLSIRTARGQVPAGGTRADTPV
jgi:hypothetical protein